MPFAQASSGFYYYQGQPTLMFWSKNAPTQSPFRIEDTFQITDRFNSLNAFDIDAVSQDGPVLGYLVFVDRDVHEDSKANTEALKNLAAKLDKLKTPYVTSFVWARLDADSKVTPLYLTTWSVVSPPATTLEVRIEEEAVLGYNTEGVFEANRPGGINQPLNLPLEPEWTLHPKTANGDYTGFWLTYPSQGIPGADPPRPMPGHNLYLSLTDTPGCGCLTWQGVEYFSGIYMGFDYLLDPLHRERTIKRPNRTRFRLKPTGEAMPAYSIDMLGGPPYGSEPQDSEPTDSPYGTLLYVIGDPQGAHYVQEYPLFAPLDPTNLDLLPSYLRTTYNQRVYLKLLDTSSVGIGTGLGPDGKSMTYSIPQGDFELYVPPFGATGATGSGPPYHLLCGLEGTESMEFNSGDRITFSPGPAHAPSFPLTRRLGRGPTALLQDDYTTAWASINPDATAVTSVTYYSQPRDAALFGPTAAPGVTGVTGATGLYLLELFHAPVARFGPTGSGPTGGFPLVPYAGLSPTTVNSGVTGLTWADIPLFEQQILNPQRRKVISDYVLSQRAAASGPTATTATPQGLLATTQDMTWHQVTLAQSVSDDDGQPAGPTLQFRNLAEPLRDALQTNQLFLVISQTANLGDFDHKITIDAWPFQIDLDKNAGVTASTDYSNVLIFKFRPGALSDMVDNLAWWTHADTFNGGKPADVQTWINTYLTDARQQAQLPGNEDYQNFISVIDNPAWTGILALKVDISVGAFPQQLQGLLAGIDLSRFYAHHFGVNVSNVHLDGGKLAMPRSSLFALISYIDQDVAGAGSNTGSDPDHDFKVSTLVVLFANSKIKDFHSRVMLTTKRWFGEPATLETDSESSTLPAFTIELDGHYEHHDGHDVYTFVTREGADYTFSLASQVLRSVEIVKAQFTTTRSQKRNGSQEIDTVFTFWGYLSFHPQPGFDLFSFGSPEGSAAHQQGLYFSHLNLPMNFELQTSPLAVTNRQFTFDPVHMVFDPKQSISRSDSLFNRFPMLIEGLLTSQGPTGAPGPKPHDLGYVPVQPPSGFNPAPLGDTWYGLHCQLKMGTFGALAGKAGFAGDLLLAWSPSAGQGDQPSAAIALKMPGGNNQGFSLENVLKVGIEGFDMLTARPQGPTGPVNYALQLNHIGLKVLGVNFPPSAQLDLYLFGGATGSAGNLGWYGAYIGPTGK